MYRVIEDFIDLQDGERSYKAGDIFRVEGKSKERLRELSSAANRRGIVLIKEEPEPEKPKKPTKKGKE